MAQADTASTYGQRSRPETRYKKSKSQGRHLRGVLRQRLRGGPPQWRGVADRAELGEGVVRSRRRLIRPRRLIRRGAPGLAPLLPLSSGTPTPGRCGRLHRSGGGRCSVSCALHLAHNRMLLRSTTADGLHIAVGRTTKHA